MKRSLAAAQVVMTLDDMTPKRVLEKGGVKLVLGVHVGSEEVSR